MKMTNYIWNETEIPTRRVFPTGHKERGIALLLTIFGLLLLTAVAAAMMFSSDSETQIAVNYRDSQVASYAAMAALQEARDRIHPVSGDLGLAKLGYVPTKTLDNGGQVLYIVNPLIGETVQPWNPANAYFDQELCQENTLGLSGTPGSACTTAPAGGCSQAGTGGGGWCSFYDNSANATTWQLFDTNGKPIPMDSKWVRISLKQDKNTPVYVPDPTTATGTTQVCWDGNYQAPLPNNYASTCAASAGNQVIGVNVTAAGS